MAFGVGGAIGEAFVVVRPDTRGFAPAAKQGILGPMKGLALATGGLFAAVGVASFLKDSVDEAREAVKVGKQTDAVLKSTGGAAKISAAGISALATSLSNKTAIDDEAIQSNENLLLTFKGIKNQAGKGNDIFNQATASVLDMSVAFKQDGKASAIQLGKALDNPVKGVTALQRVGVSFTDQQKDQIKTLVKSGNVLGAQKIILAGLREQTAGAAEAAADPWQRFQVVMGNVKESIGTALLPTINKVVGFLADKLPGALETAGGFFRAAFDRIKAILTGFGKIVGPIFQSIVKAVGPAAAAFGKALMPAIRSLINTFKNDLLPVLKVVAIVIGAVLFIAITKVLPVVLRLAGPVLGLLLKVVGFIIGRVFAFIGLIGRMIGAFLKWATGTKTVGDALRALGRGAALAFAQIVGAVRVMLGIILGAFSGIIHGAATAFGWVPGIGPKLKTAAAKFDGFKDTVLGALEDTAAGATRWGNALGDNYAAGIQAKIGKVRGSALAIANVVKANMKGASPPKEGPLREGGGMEQWGRNQGASFAKGLAASAAQVSAAFGSFGGQAIPGVTMPRRQVPTQPVAAGAGGSVTQHFTLVQQPGQSAPAFVQAAMFAARTQLRPAG